MKFPFTTEQFIEVFKLYNTSVWPFQAIIYIVAIIAVALIFTTKNHKNKIISLILAFLWLWMGLVYHWMFFSVINPVAKIFGIFFIIQGLMFIYFGLKNKLEFKFIRKDWQSYFGLLFVFMGLLIYPAFSFFMGHIFPNNPTFGLPCPTTIFTLGMLLLSTRQSKLLPIIPFIWSLIGFMAAVSMGIKEDVLLLIAGLSTIIFYYIKRK